MPNIRISQLDTAAQIRGTDYLVVDDTSTTKRATFNSLFNSDIAKQFKGGSITLTDYGVRSTTIQMKGRLVTSPGKEIVIYTAVFVANVTDMNVGQTVQGSVSNKTGTIKSIDGVNKILYIQENAPTLDLDFIIGEFLNVQNASSVIILKVEDFKRTLLANQTLKIFYAAGVNSTNSVAAAVKPPQVSDIGSANNLTAPKAT